MKIISLNLIFLFLLTKTSFSQQNIENNIGKSIEKVKIENQKEEVTDPVILTLGCSTAKFSPKIAKKGEVFMGTAIVKYTDGNGNSFGEFSAESTGVLGLTATLSAGTLVSGDDSFLFTIFGTPKSSGTALFLLSIAQVSCTMSLKVD